MLATSMAENIYERESIDRTVEKNGKKMAPTFTATAQGLSKLFPTIVEREVP